MNTQDKKILLSYCPHGLNENTFKPLPEDEITSLKNKILGKNDFNFIIFFNSRNIRRKQIPDTLWAYKIFMDSLPEEKAKKCLFILHTDVINEHGTDLMSVKEYMFDKYPDNVIFSSHKISDYDLNCLYNIADATILLTSNEGWGLSLTESILAGTPIIANVQGGMQDQMRFEDDNGNWIDFDEDFPSNNKGRYQKCGNWAFPVYPSNISIQGSPLTPYIADNRCNPEDAAEQILKVYNLSRKERKERGLEGRNWALSDEAGFTGKKMTNKIIKSIDYLLDNWKPRESFEFINTTKHIPDTSRKLIINY